MDRTKYMDEKEVAKLVRKATADAAGGTTTDKVRWMIVDLALGTGFRASEMLSLRWCDVNLDAAYIRVRRGKKRRGKPVVDAVAIGDELAEHLDAYRSDLRIARRPASDADPVIAGRSGGMTRTALWRSWQMSLSRAGLSPRPLHDARHTLAVHLLKTTSNLRLVQKQLGHSSPEVTANIYADVPFDDMQAAINGVYKGGA